MRREQYLRYYKETESMVDILVDQSEDKIWCQENPIYLYRRKFLVLKRKNRKTVSSQKKRKKQQQIPCNRRGFVLFYYGAVKLQP